MNFFPIRKCWRVKLMELQIRRRLLLSAKADNIPQPAPWTNRVKEKHELVKQNQALAITIQEMKRREDSTSYWYKELEKTRDGLYADIQRQRNRIEDLEARLATNQAELISELRDTITTLEEDVEVASWNEGRYIENICRLEEMVNSKNISRLEGSIDWERSHNCILRDKICGLAGEIGELNAQIRYLQASRPVGEKAGERDKYLSDDNVSLFSHSDDNESI